ncbi:unnamed protein product [Parnassius mnemosyne]|uniref:Protein CASC3 n=1 Tax=Parnassius mnemosyne TaxID=213953 RepID=A0AAV1L7P7_9NEOP
MTSVARRREQDDSGEFSDASQDIDQSNSANDGVQNESDYDSAASESEHSDRDPESQESERRVDDDEDRSNPQYIPKRGTFYEHDDRTAASGEESTNTTSDVASEKKEGSEAPAERRRPPRKSETVNKWSHDKYNENEQMPKSREELVAIYGYDIRNEDAPPHARRNRRYGRGPNKYTRTWEDEEAYRRQAAAQQPHRKPPNPEEFPELDAPGKKFNKKARAPRPRSKSQPASNESSDRGSQLRRNASIKTPKSKPTPKPNIVKQNPVNKSMSKTPVKDKLPPLENLTITTTVVNNSDGQTQPQRRVSAAVAQQRPVPTEQGKRKPTVNQPPQQNNVMTSKQPAQQQPVPQQQKPQQQQQQNQQPQQTSGAESKAGGSKRYSSLRQRPLAEPYSPQQPQQQQPLQQPQPQQQTQQQPPQQPQQQQQQTQQQQHRYHGEYAGNTPPQTQHQGSPVPQIHPQQLIHQVHRNTTVNQPHGPSPPHQALQQQQHSQQVRLGILEQPPQMVSHPHHSIHNIPPQHSIGQLQPAQGYAPPAMMPAQFMQQGGSGAVYSGPAMFAQPPAAYPHQIYPHHNYATQAGGVTYYNCAEQEPPPPQPRAQRRPTAAIPIVRPAAPERPANSTEKDNIDRIVENMFVRKPWPAQGAEASKEKSQENRSSQEPQSKESSQPNSLTSSSISTDSKPAESTQKEAEDSSKSEKEVAESEASVPQESISTDA